MRSNFTYGALIAAALVGFIVGAEVRSNDKERKSGTPARSASEDNARHGESALDALEPLDPNLLRKRISDIFSAGYLTLVAIIQGVAFGVVLSTARHAVFSGPVDSRLTSLAQTLAVLVAIIVVTNQYFLLTEMVRWTPTVLDTVIPYALGMGEVGSALTVGDNSLWWGAVSILIFASVMSFLYSGMRATEEVFGSMKDLHRSFRRSVRFQTLICGFLLLCSTGVTLLSIYTSLPTKFYILAPCALSAGGIWVGIAGARDQDKDYESYGIPIWRSSRPKIETQLTDRRR